jgi:hypothetical protein
MKNIIKFCFFATSLCQTSYAMDPNASHSDMLKIWQQITEEDQKQQALQDKQTKIAAAKYYMLTDQLVPLYLLSELDKETHQSARTHNERLLRK